VDCGSETALIMTVIPVWLVEFVWPLTNGTVYVKLDTAFFLYLAFVEGEFISLNAHKIIPDTDKRSGIFFPWHLKSPRMSQNGAIVSHDMQFHTSYFYKNKKH